MSSDYASVRAYSPLAREMTLAILKYIKSTNICYEEKICINADLVPRVSERVMQASMKQKMTPSFMLPSIEVEEPKFEYKIPKRDMSRLVEPIRERYRAPVYTANLMAPQSPSMVAPESMTSGLITSPPVSHEMPQEMEVTGDYGRINDFIRDPTISSIECPGPGKPLSIVRAGMRQMTRIVLSPEEIEGILKGASESSHIPLLEGVFRADADNFMINAVISEMIGSRFIIKKNTPYSLLESNQ